MYQVKVNDIDVTKYCTKLPENTNAKERLELFLLPKYEFSFVNRDDILSSIDNIYYKDIAVKLIDSRTSETIITGNILDIKKEVNTFTLSVGSENDKYQELAALGNWYNQNPVKIIYDICKHFNIPINQTSYKRACTQYEKFNIRVNFYPDKEITLLEFLNKLKETTDLDLYISNGELIIERLNDRKDITVTLTDKDILTASIEPSPKIYTNYNVKSVETARELTDDTVNGKYKKKRQVYGNVSLESVDGSAEALLQIPTKDTAVWLQENRLSYYAKEKRTYSIVLPFSKYGTLRLQDLIQYNSNFFRVSNIFELREKTIDFLNNRITLKIQELEEATAQTTLISGYGLTPYGLDYGN